MAVNFLDGITVDSGTGSAPTIIAEGIRPVTIKGGAIGSVAIGGSNGGWATGYFFTGYSGTNRGGFGALGSVDTLSYYWIGDAYNDTTMVVQPNAGNVGIGTTSPSTKLHISAASSNSQLTLERTGSATGKWSIHTNTDNLFFNNSAGSNRLVILNSGSVGIGTSTPTERLHVKTSGVEVAKYETTATADLAIELANSQGSMFFGLGGGEQFGIGTTSDLNGTGNLFIIEQGGDVGIGTTSPGAKLEINDAIAPKMRFGRSSSYYWDIGHTASDFQIQSATGGTIMHLNYDGNVGVGTTSPSEKLQVNGAVRATSYKSSDGSAGVTATFTVRNGNNSAALTLTVKNGIITSVSSDRRLKENITLIGTSDSGINIYTYEYKYKFSLAGVGLFQGVMSDEVPAEAVSVDEYGYDMVDYSLIDVEFKRLSN